MERFIEHGNGIALVPFAKSYWCSDLWAAADGLCFTGPSMSEFVGAEISGVRSNQIYMPCHLAAFGEENVAALEGVGRVRV